MQAPKNGFFVLDAATGELISVDAFTDMTRATGIDENGRPIEVPEARSLEEDFVVLPGPTGAYNWHPMSYSPDTGLVYIPTNIWPLVYSHPDPDNPVKSNWNIGYREDAGWPLEIPPGGIEGLREMGGGSRWPGTRSRVRRAGPYPSRFLSTAAPCRWPVARCSRPTRRVNWWPTTPRPVSGFGPWSAGPRAAPMTYEVDGEQYISILSGWGSTIAMVYGVVFEDAVARNRSITFKVGGNGELPKPLETGIARTPKSAPIGDEAQHSKGLTLFAANCQWCHGAFAVSSGVLPDLRWSAMTATESAWDTVVRDGALSDRGMVGVGDRLDKAETDAIAPTWSSRPGMRWPGAKPKRRMRQPAWQPTEAIRLMPAPWGRNSRPAAVGGPPAAIAQSQSRDVSAFFHAGY